MSSWTAGGEPASNSTGTAATMPAGLGIDEEGHADSARSSMDASQLSPTMSNGKRRKSSKHKNSKHLGRAVSTPHMRDGAISDDDKKRNKLGYQRISIACAHCRRRKIRCVMADADLQQRCQNCIRLKKECVFYPVEQQNALDGRAESSSNAGSDAVQTSMISVSPPSNVTDRPFDANREFAPFASLPSNASSTYQGLPLEPGSALMSQGYSMKDHSYRNDAFGRTWPSTTSIVTDSSDTTTSSTYSRYSHAPSVNGDFSPFPSNEPMQISPHNAHPPAFEYGVGRPDMPWSQHQHQHQHQQQHATGMRSMSYGQLEQAQNNHAMYQSSYPASTRSPLPAMHYQQPTLHTQGMPPLGQHSAPHSAPVGIGNPTFAQVSPYAFNQHPEAADNSHVGATMINPNLANPWYNERPGFTTLAEEPDKAAGGTRRS